MTNKYLVKIARDLQHDKDVAKTFVTSSVAGWTGHALGAAAGAAGLGLLASKNKTVGRIARKAVVNSKLLIRNVRRTPVGKFVYKHTHGGGAAALAGGVVGGVAGEEAANYLAIRHGVNKAKQNDK